VLALAVPAVLAISGCGGEGAKVPEKRTVVRVVERDFAISAPKVLPAGEVEFAVENRGPDDHELIVARAGEEHHPFRADGLTIDEDAIEPEIVGALEPEEPGRHKLRVRLEPGRYVLMCNMAGHYLGGMDRDVVVR
jgi:uncharacterized cupredoxin-like copper-binding protein